MRYESEYTKMLKTKSLHYLSWLHSVNRKGYEKVRNEYPGDMKRMSAYEDKLNAITDEIMERK